MLRKFRKPLILLTPKSLLRHPKVISETKEFTSATFKELLDDPNITSGGKAERLLMCSGKIYFELAALRETRADLAQVPVLRLEQIYPFPYEVMSELLKTRYPQVQEVVWVQEEPQNMGAWNFVRSRISKVSDFLKKVTYVGRKNSGSTAEGSSKAHALEQKRILDDAFALASAGKPSLVPKQSKKS
jgi:2-oxoglutarate dehydrogenase E1 component